MNPATPEYHSVIQFEGLGENWTLNIHFGDRPKTESNRYGIPGVIKYRDGEHVRAAVRTYIDRRKAEGYTVTDLRTGDPL